jgi:hypothetical protein
LIGDRGRKSPDLLGVSRSLLIVNVVDIVEFDATLPFDSDNCNAFFFSLPLGSLLWLETLLLSEEDMFRSS